MPASSSRRFPAPLFRHFPPFSSNLISKTISTSLTWLTAEAHRPALSVGLHAFIPTLVKDVLKVSPPQTELKLLGAATGARAELPLQPPKHRHSIAACPLHVHRWFCTAFISFGSVLAQRGGAEVFPREAGGQQGPWATAGAAEGCSISPAALWIKARSEAGKCSLARDCTSLLTVLLWTLPVLLHLRAQFNDWNWFFGTSAAVWGNQRYYFFIEYNP